MISGYIDRHAGVSGPLVPTVMIDDPASHNLATEDRRTVLPRSGRCFVSAILRVRRILADEVASETERGAVKTDVYRLKYASAKEFRDSSLASGGPGYF
jgi:hypothetical protein